MPFPCAGGLLLHTLIRVRSVCGRSRSPAGLARVQGTHRPDQNTFLAKDGFWGRKGKFLGRPSRTLGLGNPYHRPRSCGNSCHLSGLWSCERNIAHCKSWQGRIGQVSCVVPMTWPVLLHLRNERLRYHGHTTQLSWTSRLTVNMFNGLLWSGCTVQPRVREGNLKVRCS